MTHLSDPGFPAHFGELMLEHREDAFVTRLHLSGFGCFATIPGLVDNRLISLRAGDPTDVHLMMMVRRDRSGALHEHRVKRALWHPERASYDGAPPTGDLTRTGIILYTPPTEAEARIVGGFDLRRLAEMIGLDDRLKNYGSLFDQVDRLAGDLAAKEAELLLSKAMVGDLRARLAALETELDRRPGPTGPSARYRW